MTERPSITCPKCGRTSYHPKDIAERYCGDCGYHDWIGRMKIFTIAHVPQELANAWLQHMRDFDTANPGCHFEVGSDCPDMTVQELLQIVRINPELKVRVDKDITRVIEQELRAAGCRCAKPLLGYRPGVGPRCRVCNAVVKADE